MLDLHTHSTASDGTLSPKEIVALADRIGLSAVAITDHDTVDGIAEAMAHAQGKRIRFIPGVELSAEYQRGALHIVGLFVCHTSLNFKKVLDRVKEMREERNPKIIQKLNALGVNISMTEVAQAAGGTVVGRPHFAKVLVEKGYVRNTNKAFLKYLGNGGAAAVPKERLSIAECIQSISDAGGVPILAHPDQLNLNLGELDLFLKGLVEKGLRGIEVHCTPYTTQMTYQYSQLASKYNLVKSGGTDFHGEAKKQIRLGRGFGSLCVPDELLPAIEQISMDSAKN